MNHGAISNQKAYDKQYRTGKLRKIISGLCPSAVGVLLLLLLCGGLAGLTVQAQNPVITSFSANGSPTCRPCPRQCGRDRMGGDPRGSVELNGVDLVAAG